MRLLDRQSAAAFLRMQGVMPETELEKVLSGFDFTKPVYEHAFFPGDRLYQLVRLPSFDLPNPVAGNWFGLAGLTTGKVAINDGGAGRRAGQFEVLVQFSALEGTAREFAVDLRIGIGGPGGGTQIFVPRTLLGRVRSVGPVDRW